MSDTLDPRYTMDFDEPHIAKRWVAIGNEKNYAGTPEQELWTEVVIAALEDASGITQGSKRPSPNNTKLTLQQEALAWFQSDGFEEVCENLGIDVAYARKWIATELEAYAIKKRRSKETIYARISSAHDAGSIRKETGIQSDLVEIPNREIYIAPEPFQN